MFLILLLSLTYMPLDLQIALDRASQVQDIALVVVVVGAGGDGGADDV